MPDSTKRWSFFQLPEPLRLAFSHFPLRSYEKNSLPTPLRASPGVNVFYTFQRSPARSPSPNPSCLKFQALLEFYDIKYEPRPSNNHASPSGSLPFLLPASKPEQRPSSPITGSKIPKWAATQAGRDDSLHAKEEAYSSLVDHNLRNAWLYFLYLDPNNFRYVAHPLYCESASSNILVQRSLARQLQSAARDELLKSCSLIDPESLYDRAAKALQALSTLLGSNKYFFAAESPGLFDASVFAYTHLLLDEEMKWSNSLLPDLLRQHDYLVQHRDRLLRTYFS